LPAAEALAIKKEGVRTVRLRLLPTLEQERELDMMGDLCAKMWNELNYERRKLFEDKEKRLTSEAMRETHKKYYEKYKGSLGSTTAKQVASMNDEAWRSFFAMLKAKEEGRLPPFIKKVSPPGYWKDKALGERVKIIPVQYDGYVVVPVSAGEGYIEITTAGGRKMRIMYVGKVRWAGRQGRMLIVKEAGRWFAYIPVEVGAEAPKWYRKGYISGELKSIRQREPKGDGAAFIDMGLNNLFAIVTTSGDAALIKGGGVKAEYNRGKREVKTIQGVRDKLKDRGLEAWKRYHHMCLRAYFKWYERLRHLYRTAIRFTAEWLYEKGVRKVYLGYPYMISQDNGNEYNANIWWFRKIARWLYEVLQEYGIELYIVLEYRTSKECSICRIEHEGARIHRGLYICEKTGKKLNADLNAAANIARRAGYIVAVSKRIESYKVTHSGVMPITPRRRG